MKKGIIVIIMIALFINVGAYVMKGFRAFTEIKGNVDKEQAIVMNLQTELQTKEQELKKLEIQAEKARMENDVESFNRIRIKYDTIVESYTEIGASYQQHIDILSKYAVEMSSTIKKLTFGIVNLPMGQEQQTQE